MKKILNLEIRPLGFDKASIPLNIPFGLFSLLSSLSSAKGVQQTVQ